MSGFVPSVRRRLFPMLTGCSLPEGSYVIQPVPLKKKRMRISEISSLKSMKIWSLFLKRGYGRTLKKEKDTTLPFSEKQEKTLLKTMPHLMMHLPLFRAAASPL